MRIRGRDTHGHHGLKQTAVSNNSRSAVLIDLLKLLGFRRHLLGDVATGEDGLQGGPHLLHLKTEGAPSDAPSGGGFPWVDSCGSEGLGKTPLSSVPGLGSSNMSRLAAVKLHMGLKI